LCGIAGIVRRDPGRRVDPAALRRMARAIRHRGPDGYGTLEGAGAGLVATRLAIVDPEAGWQPLRGRDGCVLVYNGEVYDHRELRAELEGAGERFATACDTEVVLRLLEREGPAALPRLNGQFGLAFWEPVPRRLTLARDPFGVRPLHFALLEDGGIAFASEAKALFASGDVIAEPDLAGIDEVFSLWAPRAPRTAFKGVSQLPPGGLLVWENGIVTAQRRWWIPGRQAGDDDGAGLLDLLRDSVSLRLRADVPVGAYLSGGLDSSVITALAAEQAGHRLETFSVVFSDPRYDEREYQQQVAGRLGTRHHVVEASSQDVAEAFPAVVAACETPLVRTAPVPLWLLARETRAQGITVVLTGEGADELFWGYDLFKEVALREMHARDPERAAARVDELYPELAGAAARRGPAWRRFLLETGEPDDPLASHRTRAVATGVIRNLYRPEVAEAVAQADPLAALLASLPDGFGRWPALERAGYLEITTLLGDHLLSAQGDRVAMAHGVEGRYPFLDPRVAVAAAQLAPQRKLDGLRDKAALRDAAARVLDPSLAQRRKQPYRAPEIAPFFEGEPPAWVQERLSDSALSDVGIFDERRVAALLRSCRAGDAAGHRAGMALVGVLSTQVWHQQLCEPRVSSYPEETDTARVHLDDQVQAMQGAP
jgi:asparagine synthase (glutamine-hydrolysing)